MDLISTGMVSKIADFFIPAHYQTSKERRRLARLLVFILMYGGLGELLAIPNAISMQFVEAIHLMWIGGISNFIILLLFRQGLWLIVCVNLHLGLQAAFFLLQAWWGGGVDSPASFALFFQPIIATLLIGKRWAIGWLIICLSIVSFLYVYEQRIGSLPIRYNPTTKDLYFFRSIIGEIVVLFIMVLVFNNEKNRAIDELIQTNEQLVITQNQLIQKEKMASLGELMAGIAHEIQNPLNFVNNFAGISIELIDELKQDSMDQLPEAVKTQAEEILIDLTGNMQKIAYHGSRASAVVRAMLEHSRMQTGERQVTDINALCDEYLRLSYHGLRAKNNVFNALLETNFDKDIPKLNVVPQDIGRVLLNLFNNAFYAVDDQKKQHLHTSTVPLYQPMVSVSTKKQVQKGSIDRVEIRVSDNGAGIADAIKDKIFQPFFTTKPIGKGTGMGLSLSYDIITKGHGGELRMTCEIGKLTEFIISLPVMNG